MINEWLWSDLAGENGENAVRDTAACVVGLVESAHEIVVVRGSTFDQKLLRTWSKNLIARNAVMAFRALRLDSARCRSLEPDDLAPLSPELAQAVKTDDHYLVQACIATDATVVTTDAPLRGVLANAKKPAIDRDTFVDLCRGGPVRKPT
ncbi:MAG: hypothetical protein WBO45_00810 [Planctomycetota bacterium]